MIDITGSIPIFEDLEEKQHQNIRARDQAIEIILEYERLNFKQCIFIYTVGLCHCVSTLLKLSQSDRSWIFNNMLFDYYTIISVLIA